MIVFKSIKYKNFLSTGNAFTEFPLNKNHMTLILGSNGSGKCLRGSTEVDIKIEDPEVLRAFTEFCSVKLINTMFKTDLKTIAEFYDQYPEYIGSLKVSTRYGYKIVEFADITAFDSEVITIKTLSGKKVSASPDHMFFVNSDWKKVKDISLGDIVETKVGDSEIVSIKKEKNLEDLYDLQVEGVKEFYANDIVSHNSTMLCAITFALFGKSFRNINKPNLVNSINGKDCVVEIEFSVSLKNYRIVRGLKPSKFEIYCEGALINQEATTKDYQDYLEKNILKFNMKAFTQIVLLGSASFVPFMQLTANDRRMIIEDLLDIQIFSSMNSVVKDRMNSLKNEAAEIKRSIENTKAQIELQEKYIEDSKKNSSDQIQSKEEELEKIRIEISEWANKGVLVATHRDAMSKSLEKNLECFQTKKREFDSLEIKIESNLKKIEKNLNFFMHNSTCPTCDQSINNKEIKVQEFQNERNKYDSGLESLRKQKVSVEDNLKKALEVQRKINDHTTEIKSIEATIKQLNKYEEKLSTELNELKSKKTISDEITELSDQLKSKMLELEEQKKEYIDKKQYIEIASSLLKDNGIKAKIIKQYLPIINKLVNKYLSAMNFFVNFEIDEEFKETIKSRYRDDFSYSNFSEGERMRIDLALMLTWRAIAKMKNSMNTNLLILDEVFDSSLDSSGTEEFMKLINSLGSDVNVFVISHKGDVLVDKFTNTIKFDKRRNFSEMSVQ